MMAKAHEAQGDREAARNVIVRAAEIAPADRGVQDLHSRLWADHDRYFASGWRPVLLLGQRPQFSPPPPGVSEPSSGRWWVQAIGVLDDRVVLVAHHHG